MEQLVADFNQGSKVKQLAMKYGVDVTTVRKHLRARGVDLRRPALTPDEVDAAVKLYEQGWPISKIAEQYYVKEDAVRYLFRQAGVVMRKPWERPSAASASIS